MSRATMDNQRGSALTLVLIFSTLALAMASAYMLGQRRHATYWLSQPRALQARLNAYSAVYWALDYLRDSTRVDTLKTIDATDSLFNAGLTKDDDPLGDAIDPLLPLGGEPVDVELYDTAGYGAATVARVITGASIRLQAEGERHGVRKRVEALLGSHWPVSPDTLLLVKSDKEIETPYGPLIWAQKTYDSSDFRSAELAEIVRVLSAEMVDTFGIPGMEMPTTVLDQRDLADIPERVKGDLLIEPTFATVRWNTKRRIVVEGDLQVGGEAFVRGIDFVVQGEARISGEAELRDVSIVTGKRFVMMDAARLSGDVLSMADIVLAHEVEVRDKSVLVATGQSGRRAVSGSGGSGKGAVPGARTKAGTPSAGAGATGTATGSPFAIVLSDFALVDGSLIALQQPGGIHIGASATVTGIVYAQGQLCHEGLVTGVIKAATLVDCSDPTTVRPDFMAGKVEPIEDLTPYRLPSYVGRLTVLEWYEG